MKKIAKYIVTLTVIAAIGCTNDSESDLLLVDDTDEIVDNNTDDDDSPTELITFNADVRPILSNACWACHSDPPAGAPFPLVTYDQVLARAENGQLLGAISRPAGDPRIMPPSGRLPQATIDLIAQWIEDGALEE